MTSTPLVIRSIKGSSICFGDASGTLHSIALNDGKEKWTFKTRGAIYSSPGQTRTNIVFGSTDSSIYSLESDNGKLRWETKTHGVVLSPPASYPSNPLSSDDYLVIIGSSDRTMRGIDWRSGKVEWEFNNLSGFVETKPARSGEKVIFGAWDGYLYAVNEWNGVLDWKWKGDKEDVLYSPAACIPVASYGKIFIVAPDRMMTAIDVNTGKTIWRTGKYQVRESIGISEDGERVYIRTLRDSILALSTSANEPQEVWCTNVGFGYDHNYAALVEKNGTLFYGTRNGLLIALNARNGKVKWQYKTGVALLNTVAPIDGRRVVVSNVDGEVMLVETR